MRFPCLTPAALLMLPFMLNAGTPSITIVEAFPNLRFTQPTDIQNAGDGTDRLFVSERQGRIRVFDNDPAAEEAPVFLDISDAVISDAEMGLLGFTFHPDFEENGFFYVVYNFPREEENFTRLSRFTADSPDHRKADPSTEVILMEVRQPFINHDGGQIAFGPHDGYLYIALGDGGNGGDPYNNAQNRKTPLGAILRIDVDNPAEGLNYGIPATNPFVGDTNSLPEIWAWGFRNPWRFSFDPETGRMWTGDVGQERYEEIDIVEGGKNYGWRIMESRYCYVLPVDCDSTGMTSPVWGYDHSLGQSITGGYVYRGSRIPKLQGRYIYGDFVSGRIWGLDYVAEDNVSSTLLVDSNLFIVTFGLDENREIYLADYFGGRIYTLEEVPSGVDDRQQNGTALYPAIPTPASVRLRIPYRIGEPTNVRLVLFNALGEKVLSLVDRKQEEGAYNVELDVTPIPDGIYYVRLTTENRQITRKITVVH